MRNLMKYIILLFCMLLLSCSSSSVKPKSFVVTCMGEGKPALQVLTSNLKIENGFFMFTDSKTRRDIIIGGNCFAIEAE